jgi:hypothetical protein
MNLKFEEKENKVYEYEEEKFFDDPSKRNLVWCFIIFSIISNIFMLPWKEIFSGQHSFLNIVLNFLNIVLNFLYISICSLPMSIIFNIFLDMIREDDDGVSGY